MALPIIETPRLRLRPRRAADLDACLALDRSAGTARFLPELPVTDPAAHEAFVRARIRGSYPSGQGYWVIETQEAPRFLGWVLLIPENAHGPRTEIGWRLFPEFRGRGFAPEAAAHLLAHAFRSGVQHVVAEIHRDNAASRRVAEKIGMRLVEDPMEGAPEAVLYDASIACASSRC
ncbi:MAG: GNAT family N-acetyltransferase [Pseudomonadota bacterium]